MPVPGLASLRGALRVSPPVAVAFADEAPLGSSARSSRRNRRDRRGGVTVRRPGAQALQPVRGSGRAQGRCSSNPSLRRQVGSSIRAASQCCAGRSSNGRLKMLSSLKNAARRLDCRCRGARAALVALADGWGRRIATGVVDGRPAVSGNGQAGSGRFRVSGRPADDSSLQLIRLPAGIGMHRRGQIGVVVGKAAARSRAVRITTGERR
jgi:hypothetical protein